MNLYPIYVKFNKQQITEEQAAEQLGLSLTDWRFRRTKYGKRLPLILKTLDRIYNDEISRDDAAAILDVTTRQINNLMNSWLIARPLKDYLVKKEAIQIKWALRKKAAIEFIAGQTSLDQAAEDAQVSTRQMRRWVADLLDRHFGATFKDLRGLPQTKRLKMADTVEREEGFEAAKLNVLNEVTKGHLAIKQLALAEVLSRPTHRNKSHVRRRLPSTSPSTEA